MIPRELLDRSAKESNQGGDVDDLSNSKFTLLILMIPMKEMKRGGKKEEERKGGNEKPASDIPRRTSDLTPSAVQTQTKLWHRSNVNHLPERSLCSVHVSSDGRLSDFTQQLSSWGMTTTTRPWLLGFVYDILYFHRGGAETFFLAEVTEKPGPGRPRSSSPSLLR